ncbi:phosphate ABC transporter substrate-binding protein PstS [Thermithiobacillus plumbiphilus]|uniref:Phosphate-binding protein PstS n=1 Tax=Thermithiobacillus plumbiphilus TaxID=1729899 RepID=A0ABU9D592_9PROT
MSLAKNYIMRGLCAGVMAVGFAGFTATAQAAQITGAGSTFVYPVISKWAEAYKAKTGNSVNYQSIGSGGGIAQIKAGTVDFGASDMPLAPQELDKQKLAQFPAVMGGVVPVVNLPGIKPGQIRFNGKVLADIYLGKITKWNDPAIKTLNPRLNLPNSRIVVVHRSDGSGTTFNFVNYLSKVSPEWKTKVGEGTSVAWPTGVGGKGNEGVSAYVGRLKGSIGYVEYAYAHQNRLVYGAMQSRDGTWVLPSDDTFQAAAANADWAKTRDFYLILTNQPGAQSWPITGTSWLLVRKDAAPQKNKSVMDFATWFLNNGQQIAKQLDYVPMPAATVKQIMNYSKAELKM